MSRRCPVEETGRNSVSPSTSPSSSAWPSCVGSIPVPAVRSSRPPTIRIGDGSASSAVCRFAEPTRARFRDWTLEMLRCEAKPSLEARPNLFAAPAGDTTAPASPIKSGPSSSRLSGEASEHLGHPPSLLDPPWMEPLGGLVGRGATEPSGSLSRFAASPCAGSRISFHDACASFQSSGKGGWYVSPRDPFPGRRKRPQ